MKSLEMSWRYRWRTIWLLLTKPKVWTVARRGSRRTSGLNVISWGYEHEPIVDAHGGNGFTRTELQNNIVVQIHEQKTKEGS